MAVLIYDAVLRTEDFKQRHIRGTSHTFVVAALGITGLAAQRLLDLLWRGDFDPDAFSNESDIESSDSDADDGVMDLADTSSAEEDTMSAETELLLVTSPQLQLPSPHPIYPGRFAFYMAHRVPDADDIPLEIMARCGDITGVKPREHLSDRAKDKEDDSARHVKAPPEAPVSLVWTMSRTMASVLFG